MRQPRPVRRRGVQVAGSLRTGDICVRSGPGEREEAEECTSDAGCAGIGQSVSGDSRSVDPAVSATFASMPTQTWRTSCGALVPWIAGWATACPLIPSRRLDSCVSGEICISAKPVEVEEVEHSLDQADCVGLGQCVSAESKLVDSSRAGGICVCSEADGSEEAEESRVTHSKATCPGLQ